MSTKENDYCVLASSFLASKWKRIISINMLLMWVKSVGGPCCGASHVHALIWFCEWGVPSRFQCTLDELWKCLGGFRECHPEVSSCHSSHLSLFIFLPPKKSQDASHTPHLKSYSETKPQHCEPLTSEKESRRTTKLHSTNCIYDNFHGLCLIGDILQWQIFFYFHCTCEPGNLRLTVKICQKTEREGVRMMKQISKKVPGGPTVFQHMYPWRTISTGGTG